MMDLKAALAAQLKAGPYAWSWFSIWGPYPTQGEIKFTERATEGWPNSDPNPDSPLYAQYF